MDRSYERIRSPERLGSVLVGYAAAHGGAIAGDGDSRQNPFTEAALANPEKPGLEIDLMLRRVRDQVVARTNNAQCSSSGEIGSRTLLIVPVESR